MKMEMQISWSEDWQSWVAETYILRVSNLPTSPHTIWYSRNRNGWRGGKVERERADPQSDVVRVFKLCTARKTLEAPFHLTAFEKFQSLPLLCTLWHSVQSKGKLWNFTKAAVGSSCQSGFPSQTSPHLFYPSLSLTVTLVWSKLQLAQIFIFGSKL